MGSVGRSLMAFGLAFTAILLLLPAAAEAAWNQPVGGGSPINAAASQNAEQPSLTTVGGVPYVAWHEQDATPDPG
jgi:hypothetical protein